MKKLFLSLAVVSMMGVMQAQVKAPQPSPAAQVKQTVGLAEITVDYSRPSAKERKIFGDLVPFDALWRTGANGSTDVIFDSDIVFGGTAVKAGKYALYTIPGKAEWEVVLYADSELWGAPEKLDEQQVVARQKVKSMSVNPPIETFTIGFDDLRNDGANMFIAWENSMVKIPIGVNSKDAVLASIKKTLSGPSANDYFQAANFYLNEKMDLGQALEWSKKAVELRPEAFWMVKLQSEILAAKGDFKNAIATAKKAKDMAQEAGNKDYVKMNEDNIAKWSK